MEKNESESVKLFDLKDNFATWLTKQAPLLQAFFIISVSLLFSCHIVFYVLIAMGASKASSSSLHSALVR